MVSAHRKTILFKVQAEESMDHTIAMHTRCVVLYCCLVSFRDGDQ